MTVGTFFARRNGRPLAWAGALLGMLLLASCGGGGGGNNFSPRRLIVLGDEASVLLPGDAATRGRKYSVNALDPLDADDDIVDEEPLGGPLSCIRNRIWVQIVADEFGFGFDECNPRSGVDPQRGQIYAALEARVADIPAQIAAAEADGAFTSRDLVTVMVGVHDILDLYDPLNCSAAVDAARARGVTLKNLVDGMADAGSGARVMYATLADVGKTPYGRGLGNSGSDCLSQMTMAFNTGLRITGLQNGRYIGLVVFGEVVDAILDDPSRFNYDNADEPRCGVALPDCNTGTLAVGVDEGERYFWADDLRFGAEVHLRLGLEAVQIATNNPF
jgi:outer membrane lipase/esterase